MTTASHKGAALVTGASSGIGRAVCARFAAGGYYVLVHARDEARGSKLVRDLNSGGVISELLLADFTKKEAPARLINYLKSTEQRLEVLVNNAGGVLGETLFERGEVHDPTTTYQVNVFAAYELSVLAAELMTSGVIINISSVSARSPMCGARIPLYSSAKAAISHLTQMLAVKLAPEIRVNAVSPGRTRTEAWGDKIDNERAIVSDALIERWISPGEIADAVWFLAQNKACTGTNLAVDGGLGLKAILANT